MDKSNNRTNRRARRGEEAPRATVNNNDINNYSRNAGRYRASSRPTASRDNRSASPRTSQGGFNQYSRNGGAYGSGYQPQRDYRQANAAGYGYSAQSFQTGMDEARLNHIREQQLKQKKEKRKKRGLIALLVVLILLLGSAGVAFGYMVQINSNMQENVDEDLLGALTVTDSPSDPFYMLLLGVDKSEEREGTNEYGGAYRSDSMILCRIDPKEKTATMVSIPRDTKVNIPGHGTQKINAAYAFGGPAGAINAVESVCGVEINHYAEIDFDGFAAVVDAVGGVEVDVAMEIDDSYTGHIDAGKQVLNGEQALILCRSRHAYDKYATDGDSIRAAYQRTVISAVIKKMLSGDIVAATNAVSAASQYVTTDFDVAAILGLAQSMLGIDVENDIYTAQLPTVSSYENDIWYEVIQTEAWQKMMKRVEAGLPPTEEDVVDLATGVKTANSGNGNDASSSSASSSSDSNVSLAGKTISIKNGCGISGVAAEAADKLKSTGATMSTGNADSNDYEKTLILYNDSSNAAKAEEIAKILGKGTAKQNPGNYAFNSDFLIVIGADW
ncbi:MAG: LCP family protein [Anaerotardibacter sp.]